MTKFPENLEDIEILELRGTAIKEVPSSIQFLTRLRILNMSGCSKLESFPEITVPMESLDFLCLSKTGIKEIPSSSFKHMISLRTLCLDGTPIKELPLSIKDMVCLEYIKEVPSSIQFLTRLRYLNMSGCSKLESFPEITVPMESLQSLDLSKTGIKEIPSSSFRHMTSLRCLFLDGTPIKELPLSIKDMVCLEYLALHGTPIKELPLSIKDMVSLRHLTFHGTAIKALPELPSSLRLHFRRNFTNCFQLDQKQLIEAMHLEIQSGEEIPHGRIQMVLPGSEIPEWFGDKGIGSSLTIQLPSNCHQLKGIAFCLVFQLPPPSQDMPYEVDDSNVRLYLDYHVKSKNSEHDDGDDEVVLDSQKTVLLYWLTPCDSDHMILHYELELVNHLRKYSGNEVTFKFYWGEKEDHESRRPFELKSCGVFLHFAENLRADKSSEEN